MKKINVAEAANTQLDWLVAKCEGIDVSGGLTDDERYSTNPALMWPIIEREKISIRYWDNSPLIHAYGPGEIGDEWAEGGGGLQAAARWLVMSKLGWEVEVPKELT